MADHQVDLFVVGGGSGGVRAARIAALHGARVALAEYDRMGGTCVIRGCIPKKLMVYAAEYAGDFADARAYGWRLEPPTFDWPTLTANVKAEVERLSQLYATNLADRGVEMIRGRATLTGPHTVRIGEREVKAAHILIATGGHPWIPPVPGGELALSSDAVFDLAEQPRRLAVLGGGYVGLEFAHIFAGLGSEVSLIHHGSLVLRGFDEDLRRQVTTNLGIARIHCRLEVTIDAIRRTPDGLCIELSNGDALEVDQVLYATGRRPNTAGLGLEALGIELDPWGSILVDDRSRTTVEHIYAVGDCTNRLNLTPVAIRDGHAVADNLFGGEDRRVDHHQVPTAVFSQPPAAAVGMTEEDAWASGVDVEVHKTEFRPLRYSLCGRGERVMMKLVIDRGTDRVLGAHMIGRDAAEIIQIVAVAIKMGATRTDLRRTTALHPTTAEELVLL
jgi:glutathione reductase (NADPH)